MESDTTPFKLKKLIVGGVPEHFNSPWHLAQKNGIFAKHKVEIDFREYPEGTGKMVAGLKDNSLDVAVVLTEGIVKEIMAGDGSFKPRLVATYVDAPLTWGVFASPQSNLNSLDDLKGKKIGISRFGSGSHLMSFVLADHKDWNVEQGDLEFVVANNITGLREGIKSGTFDSFMWETFTTKPHVDSGELKKIGEVVTPWPCFMIAVRKGILDNHFDAVQRMLNAIQESAHLFQTGGQESVQYVATNFNLQVEDAAKWFQGVRFSRDGSLSRRVLVKTIDTLTRAKLLPPEKALSFADLYDPRANLAMVDANEIQTLKLFYTQRVKNELVEIGKESGPLSVSDLTPFDQLHYYGARVVDDTARFLGLDTNSRVLDIGSGLGGPDRYLADKYGCHVVGVEIEQDRHEYGKILTDRCGLSQLVTHHLSDFNQADLPSDSFTHIVSWLSLLHIKNKAQLFSNCHKFLRAGGSFFFEDFVQLHPFTEQEKYDLEVTVACPYVPTFSEYKQQLQDAGFVEIVFEDLSSSWSSYARERVKELEKDRERHVRVHGEKITDGLNFFYHIIERLFAGGRLGGIRITGRKRRVDEKD